MRYLLCLFKARFAKRLRLKPWIKRESAMTPIVVDTDTNTANDNISAQLLGLTDQHIHYFYQTHEQNQTTPVNSTKTGIHHLMFDDFQALVKSAAIAGIEIKIASGFRSFERQLLIWNNKFTGKSVINNIKGEQVDITQLSDDKVIEAIMLYSALPGASRHHWGCDIDIYAANLLNEQSLQLEPWEYESSGPMAKLSTWLSDNAAEFGFYFPYDKFRGGIAAEPWHLSYAPLAEQYQSSFSLGLLKQCLSNNDIAGKSVILENLPTIAKRFILNINSNHLKIKKVNHCNISAKPRGETYE